MGVGGKGYPSLSLAPRERRKNRTRCNAQGRTTPGKIVTWTKQSKHVEGKAFDIAVTKNGKLSWDTDDYVVYGAIGKAVGLEWGGNWVKNKDFPHFQLREA